MVHRRSEEARLRRRQRYEEMAKRSWYERIERQKLSKESWVCPDMNDETACKLLGMKPEQSISDSECLKTRQNDGTLQRAPEDLYYSLVALHGYAATAAILASGPL